MVDFDIHSDSFLCAENEKPLEATAKARLASGDQQTGHMMVKLCIKVSHRVRYIGPKTMSNRPQNTATKLSGFVDVLGC